MGLIVDDPARRHHQVPVDPGQVGAAPGHLRRVRIAGVLLLTAIALRFFGFIVLFMEFLLGPVVLMASSLLFLLSGAAALSRPGLRPLAPGPGRWGLLCLTVAESVALFSAFLFLLPSDMLSWDAATEFMIMKIMPLHALALVGAAGGLLLHMRRLLRPDARLRRLTTAVLLLVMGMLAGWAAAVPLESPVLLILTMPMLPFVAMVVGLLMLAQQQPTRSQVIRAVAAHLQALEAQPAEPEILPTGARWTTHLQERPLTILIDDARLPLAVEVRVALAPTLAALRLSARDPAARDGVPTGDVMLDRLLTVQGIQADHAAALLADLHSEILGVTQGRPGSRVEDGWVILRASVGPGSSLMPGRPVAQLRTLRTLLAEATRDALTLAEALEARQATLSAAGPQHVQIAVRPRVPEG